MGKLKSTQILEDAIAEELLERSKLYFEYQADQYAAALDRIRKLEEKGLKVFASLSVIVTAFILIIRFTAMLLLNQKFVVLNILTCLAGGLTFFASVAPGVLFSGLSCSKISPNCRPTTQKWKVFFLIIQETRHTWGWQNITLGQH